MSDTNIAFAAIAPDVNAEMSRMKPNATTMVSRIMPTNANNAALLRLMVEIIRPRKPEPLRLVAKWPTGAPQETPDALCSRPVDLEIPGVGAPFQRPGDR